MTPRSPRWRADAPLWLDAQAFGQAIAEGRLADAVDTYSGDLLDGCYDEWLLGPRERLSQLRLNALERLARQLAGRGRLAEAIGFAERLVRLDPLCEGGYRLLRMDTLCTPYSSKG